MMINRNRRLKILMVSSLLNHTPPYGYGGIERFVHSLAKELNNRGNNILLIRKKGSKGGGYSYRNILLNELYLETTKAISQHNPDIIHINLKDEILLESLKNIPIPTVVTIHNNVRHNSGWVSVINDSSPNMHYTVISQSLKHRVIEALRVNNVIVNQESIQVLGYGLDVKTIRETTKANPHQQGLYYIYLGTIARYKGVLDIAKEFANLRNEKLMVVGPCNSIEETKYFQQVIKICSSNQNITYYGETKNDKEKFNLISNSKGLIIATGYDRLESDCHEAFGLVMLEANALGKPIIGYTKGNVKDYIINGTNGYKFTNIKEISEIMKRVNLECWSNKCVEYANHYDIKKITDNYEKYFIDMCKIHKTKRGNP